MKRFLVTLLAGVLFVGGCASGQAKIKGARPSKVLRHVVMFQFQDGTSQAKIDELSAAFAALPAKIDAIYDFEWGPNVSTTRKNQGYTHFFMVTFRNQAGLAAYSPNPAHQAFVRVLRPYLEKVLVFDYWTPNQ